ncbi:TPA: hypothetical protein ACP32N_006534 [Pseudomonas aeruginosa]
MTTEHSHALSPLTFTRFEVQRCIRVRYEDCEALYPIDARQNEQFLAIVSDFDCLKLGGPVLQLIETEISGETYVMLAHEQSEVLAAALLDEESSCSFSTGEYAGVRWRVLGHTTDGMPPVVLTSGNCQQLINRIADSLQELLPRTTTCLVHETYTAATADGIEYGFTFRTGQSEDSLFDLVLGVAAPHEQIQIEADQARYEWAAKAICSRSID